MVNVKIDLANDLVEVVNPITGKIEKANLVKSLVEIEPLDEVNALALLASLEDSLKLQKKLEFLEAKITTLSVKDWETYKTL